LFVPPVALSVLADDLAAFTAGALVPVTGVNRVVDVPGNSTTQQ
jgi:hypothetical protein